MTSREARLTMKAESVLAALESKYPAGSGWLTLREFDVGADYKLNGYYVPYSRFDLFALSRWQSGKHPYRRIAFEVKVSRADWLRELARPDKRAAALYWCEQYYLAAPPGLIRRDELPKEAGLIEVSEDGKAAYVVKAPVRDSAAPSWQFVGEFGYQLARQAKREGEARP